MVAVQRSDSQDAIPSGPQSVTENI